MGAFDVGTYSLLPPWPVVHATQHGGIESRVLEVAVGEIVIGGDGSGFMAEI